MNLAGDVARAVGAEEADDGGDLPGLAGTPERDRLNGIRVVVVEDHGDSREILEQPSIRARATNDKVMGVAVLLRHEDHVSTLEGRRRAEKLAGRRSGHCERW
jgi:hypothetical protein